MGDKEKYSSEFKSEVTLKALNGNQTQKEIAKEYGISESTVGRWKKLFLEKAYCAFEPTCNKSYDDCALDVDETGTRIRKLRIKNGMSTQQVGEILGIGQKIYIRYENNPMDMPSNYIVKLAILYNVSSDYLLGGLSNSPHL